MSVVKRVFVATPARDAHATWLAITDFLTRGLPGPARDELTAVAGVAASVIADLAPRDAPIVVTSDGPRTRIYCLYDEEAVQGSDANEDPAGYDPLNGDWAMSLPCEVEDLDWVSAALAEQSTRITARDRKQGIAIAASEGADAGLAFNPAGFLGS